MFPKINSEFGSNKSKSFSKEVIEKQLAQDCIHINRYANESGQQDGKLGIPQVDSTFAPAENTLHAKSQKIVDWLYTKGRPVLNELKSKYDHINKKASAVQKDPKASEAELLKRAQLKKELQQSEIDEPYEEKKNSINEDKGIHDERLADAKKNFDNTSTEVGRKELNKQLAPWLYHIIITLLGTSEALLNISSFYILRESYWKTALIGIGVGAAIAFLAHATGKLIRQFKESPFNLFYAVLILVLVTAYAILAAKLRTYFFAGQGISEGEITLTAIAFVVVTLILFIAGCFASYFAHDKNAKLTNAIANLDKANTRANKENNRIKRSVGKLDKSYQDHKNSIQRTYHDTVDQANNLADNLTGELTELRADYNSTLSLLKGLEQQATANYQESINTYRDSNIRYRPESDIPQYWAHDLPKLTLRFTQLKGV